MAFEVDAAKIALSDYSVWSGDFEAEDDRWADDIAAIEAAVAELGASPDQLVEPWKSDCPL